MLRSVKEVEGVYGVRAWGESPILEVFDDSFGTLPERVCVIGLFCNIWGGLAAP